MRKILLLFTLSAFSYLTFAQITKIAVEPVKEKVAGKIAVYDSTRNFLGEDFMQYIGQILYVKGSKEDVDRNGFFGLFNCIPDEVWSPKEEEVYKVRRFRYKKNDLYISRYEDIYDHYFEILDVLEGKDRTIYTYTKTYFLKLRDLGNDSIVYFEYNSLGSRLRTEFVIVGYFEKLKQLYIGQTYEFYDPALVKAVKDDIYLSPDTVKYAGKRYSERNHTIWKCIDISIEDGNNYDLVAVLYNETLGKAYAKLDEILPENYMNSRLWNCKTNEINISIWGEKIFNLIRQKRICLGMKRDACLLSWGEPQDIIRETDAKAVTEQWTYEGGVTLYFKNGLLEKVRQQRTDE